MFLRANILKKLMKDAYKKSNLVVADNVNTLYIAGGYWRVEINKEFVPKTILAEIIELAGELPEPGKCFTATSGGNLETDGGLHTIDTSIAKESVEVTDVIILSKRKIAQRVLQNSYLDILLVKNVYIDMIDMKSIDDKNGEYAPSGLYYNKTAGVFIWNNAMKYQIYTRHDEKHQHITEYLSSFDLNQIPEEQQ